MAADPKELREHAERCLAMAAETPNPDLRDSLGETAQRCMNLAAEIEAAESGPETKHGHKQKSGKAA
jgi:hypothetical protein